MRQLHGTCTLGRKDRPRRTADADDGDGEQSRQRQHGRLQEEPRDIRRPALSERDAGWRRHLTEHAVPLRTSARDGRARRRDRAELHAGQPRQYGQCTRSGHPGPRLLPGAASRRHARVHARWKLPGERAGSARERNWLCSPARHHDPERCAERDDRLRRHGERADRGAIATLADRHDSARRFHQPGRTSVRRRQPPGRIGLEWSCADGQSRLERSRHDRAGLSRELERQRRRGAREHDRDAARLRDELEGGRDDRPDAAVRDAEHVGPSMRPLLLALVLLAGAATAGCHTAPRHAAEDDGLSWTQIPTPPATEGAIYSAGRSSGLIDNPVARNVGDVLTVVLNEATDAQKTATTTTSKSTNDTLPGMTLLGKAVTLHGVPISIN